MTRRIEPPALPLATETYNRAQANQTHNILRLFFNRLTQTVNTVISDTSTTTSSVSTATTTSGTATYIVTAAVTITLNASPNDGETVRVKRATTAGAVTVSGNGKNIDGSATYSMLINYDAKVFVYSSSADEWYIL